MTIADRLIQWNQWFDSAPEARRSHIVLWPLVLIGFLNMQMTIAGGFPFGLLVLLALAAMAAVRAPYKLGWVRRGEQGARLEVGRIDWLHDLNARYDALGEPARLAIPPAIMVVAGLLNIWLLAARGWAFGSLFLVALVALVLIRAPYSWGLITPPPADRAPAAGRDWFAGIDAWYVAQPSERRFLALLAGLALALLVDSWLAHVTGLSLGLVILLSLLALAALRARWLAAAFTLPPRRAPLLAAPAPAAIAVTAPEREKLIVEPLPADPVEEGR